MSEAVLDSSAILALLLAETGAEAVRASLPEALLSTVNFAEVVAKLTERGMPIAEARAAVESTGIKMVDFDADQAAMTGELRPETGAIGLSLGDRACLGLARMRGLPALTVDTAWAQAPGFHVVLIRGGGAGPA